MVLQGGEILRFNMNICGYFKLTGRRKMENSLFRNTIQVCTFTWAYFNCVTLFFDTCQHNLIRATGEKTHMSERAQKYNITDIN